MKNTLSTILTAASIASCAPRSPEPAQSHTIAPSITLTRESEHTALTQAIRPNHDVHPGNAQFEEASLLDTVNALRAKSHESHSQATIRDPHAVAITTPLNRAVEVLFHNNGNDLLIAAGKVGLTSEYEGVLQLDLASTPPFVAECFINKPRASDECYGTDEASQKRTFARGVENVFSGQGRTLERGQNLEELFDAFGLDSATPPEEKARVILGAILDQI